MILVRQCQALHHDRGEKIPDCRPEPVDRGAFGVAYPGVEGSGKKAAGPYISCSAGDTRAASGTECCLQYQLLGGRTHPVPFVLALD